MALMQYLASAAELSRSSACSPIHDVVQGGLEGWLHSAEADPVGQDVLTLLADFAYGSVLWRGQCSLTDLIRNGSARQVAALAHPHPAMQPWDLRHTVQRSHSATKTMDISLGS